MYIKEIEIDNFKSFANKTTIPFLEGFTTVSGPNGSGKSNIIDSILFALGLSSSKTLRADRIYQLINTHNKRTEASVKVSFTENGLDTALSVTRKIKKTSSGFVSVYCLNEKVSTLSEIHDELAKYNISPGSYNVMMQGDVTGIVNTTPYERRKILDEIAGVADFDRRIEQAKKELETVEDRVDKSNIILNEIDIRLVQLEEERDTALKYQKLKQEKHEFESKLSVVRYFEIKNSFERLHESIIDANKGKKEEQKKLEELNKNLETVKEKYKEISELVKSKGENEQIEIKKQAETLKGIIARKQDAIKYTEKQVQDSKNSIKSAQANVEKLKEKIDEAQFKIENKNDEIKIIESNITKEKEELKRVLSEVTNINQSTNEHLERRNQLRRKLETYKDQENVELKEKLRLEQEVSRYKRDIEDAEKKIKESEEFKAEFSSRKDHLELQISELTGELKDYEIQQKNALYELDKTKNELNDSSYNINLAYRKITQLEANKRAAEEANFGRAIDTVMNSGLAGVHAPLAQLGQVDKEYSTALEIAMGGRMAFIVVDDDEVASIAINILKSTQAGRATFLPLNKMKPAPRGMRVPNIPGVIDYAINLIDFDDVYEPAFYNALGETLVVEDLEAARKLIGKYRMVTLDGSLMEKSGSMTGGSIKKSGLKFAQSDDDELNLFKERLSELERKNSNLLDNQRELESKLNKIRHEYSVVMNELNKKKVELENMGRNLKDTDSILSSKQEIIIELAPKLEEAEIAFNMVSGRIADLSKVVEGLTIEIENIEKILPKDDLSKLNELTESIEFQIKTLESKLANCHNDIKGLNIEIDFNRNAISAQEERVQNLNKDILTLEQDKELYKKEISQTEERLEELNQKIKEIGEDLIELQQERDKVNEEVLNGEKRKHILENKIEKLLEQVEAFKTRRKELEPELFEIREELVKLGYDINSLAKTEISVEEVNRSIARLERKMQELEPVNMKALVEYDEVLNRKQELKNKIDTLQSEKTQIIERMGSYEDLKLKSFMDTFNNVNHNFKEIFYQLCDGTGTLVLENEHSPFEGGLTIEAQPRDKKMQRLESMSGGEKSITALAFIFAIQRYMPAPFYAFDEVDMHLDGINAEKLAHLVKTQSSNTQFIVVSLRKPMIESADRTIGVTQKNSGITKVTGVKLHA